jgi:hypothetical protein
MPRCAEPSCARWRPERLTPRWATGIRFNGKWFCSTACVRLIVRAGLAQHGTAAEGVAGLRPPRLGVLLRNMRAITDVQLAAALASQRVSGCRLGEELQRLGYVSGSVILRALAAQHNTSYLSSFDVARLAHGPSRLPVHMVRALALIPFDLDEAAQVVHVICAAPVPRAALRALRKLTGWSPEVYLVADDVWHRALAAYETSPDAENCVQASRSVEEAATFVAETASTDRAITMRLARWDRFAWVRVEGPTQVSNVLVPDSMEEPCPAVSIAQ